MLHQRVRPPHTIWLRELEVIEKNTKNMFILLCLNKKTRRPGQRKKDDTKIIHVL